MDNFKYVINDNLIDFLNISIYDQDFKLVDFNNIDWFMSIKFEFMYKKQLLLPDNYLTDNDPYTTNQAYYNFLAEERHKLLNEIKNKNFDD